MTETVRTMRNVGDKKIETWNRDLLGDSNVMNIEVGTNGLKGEGSRTLFCLMNAGLFPMRLKTVEDKKEHLSGVALYFKGESGLRTLVKSLRFAAQVLEDQINGVDSYEDRVW